jgi:DNA polymerase-4
MSLLEAEEGNRWRKALSAADRLRDKFGESAVSLATGLKGRFRERVHENPAGLPGKEAKKKDDRKNRDV